MHGHRISSGVLLAAAAAGAAALGSAGTAGATCASISGISAGSSGGSVCQSAPTTFAIGIGDNTGAFSSGLFTGAIAVGNNNGPADDTLAISDGAFSLAVASGKNVAAEAFGNLSVGVAQGEGQPGNRLLAQAGTQADGGTLNAAINVGGKAVVNSNNIVFSGGTANVAANFGGSSTATRPLLVQSYGTGNAAFNVGGNGSVVSAGNLIVPGAANETGIPNGTKSTLGVAFNALGNNNTVSVVGPLGV